RVTVLAIRHRGAPLPANLADQPLDFGDTLLVGGDWADIGQLWEDRENFVILTLPAEYQERLPARRRAPVAVGVLVALVAGMAFGHLPNAATALLASLAELATVGVMLRTYYPIIRC